MFKRPQRKQAVVKKWREEVEQNKEDADTDLENVTIPMEELATSSSSEEEQAPEPPQKPSEPICYSAASFLQSMQVELNLPVIDERIFAVESKLRDGMAPLPSDNVESVPEPVVVRSSTRVSQWDERSRIKVIKPDANEQADSLDASLSMDPMKALESEVMPQILAVSSTSLPARPAQTDQMVLRMDDGSSNEEDEAPLVVDLNDVLYQDDKDDPIPKHNMVTASSVSLVSMSTGQKYSTQDNTRRRDKKSHKAKKKKKKTTSKKSKHKRRRHESDTSSDSSSSSSSSESERKRRRVKKEASAVADGPTPIERRLLREAELLKKYSLKPAKASAPSS
eukprot:GILK01011920.1.p1 GENE.GILK01011920.1~~GILK01011920.1.p1  ORF type:complete len:337 (-),score=79.01 GILK01011920.1:437-1447(-)